MPVWYHLVSVPIRGLFNLTDSKLKEETFGFSGAVSVPIRGLFNLTLSLKQQIFTGSKMPKTAEIVNPPQKALYQAKIMSFNRATITTAQI